MSQTQTERAMHRRNFLKLAGSVAAAAVLPIRSPEKAVVDFNLYEDNYSIDLWYAPKTTKEWHHLGMVVQGGKQSTFLDGESVEPHTLHHVNFQECHIDSFSIRRFFKCSS